MNRLICFFLIAISSISAAHSSNIVEYNAFGCLAGNKAIIAGEVKTTKHRTVSGVNSASSKGYLGTELMLQNQKEIWISPKAHAKKIGTVLLKCNVLNSPAPECDSAIDGMPELPSTGIKYLFYLEQDHGDWMVRAFEIEETSSKNRSRQKAKILKALRAKPC